MTKHNELDMTSVSQRIAKGNATVRDKAAANEFETYTRTGNDGLRHRGAKVSSQEFETYTKMRSEGAGDTEQLEGWKSLTGFSGSLLVEENGGELGGLTNDSYGTLSFDESTDTHASYQNFIETERKGRESRRKEFDELLRFNPNSKHCTLEPVES